MNANCCNVQNAYDCMWLCLLGYKEWSKQRLLRRLLVVEKVRGNCSKLFTWAHPGVGVKMSTRNIHHWWTPFSTYQRLEDSSRTAQPAKSSSRLEKEVQATLTEVLGFTMATEAAVSVGTVTEEWEEVSDVRKRLSQLEEERVKLQQTLSSKEWVTTQFSHL